MRTGPLIKVDQLIMNTFFVGESHNNYGVFNLTYARYSCGMHKLTSHALKLLVMTNVSGATQ